MNKVQALISTHFWMGGERAVWKSSKTFPSEVLTWLKFNYTNIVSEKTRKKMLHFNNATVFLFYKDTVESHGRKITELTVCCFRESLNSPIDVCNVLSKLYLQGKLIPNVDIYISAEIRHENSVPHLPASKFTLLSLIILVIIAIFYFALGNSDNVMIFEENELSISAKELERKVNEVVVAIASQPEEICSADSLSDISYKNYCYVAFINEKCTSKTKDNYDKWLQNLSMDDKPKFMNLNCKSSMREELEQGDGLSDLSRRSKERIIDFLKAH